MSAVSVCSVVTIKDVFLTPPAAPYRCTLHPNDSLAMEGPLSRVKSLKKSLRQSFRRIRKSRVSGKKRAISTPTSKVRRTQTQMDTHRPTPAIVVVFTDCVCVRARAGSGG